MITSHAAENLAEIESRDGKYRYKIVFLPRQKDRFTSVSKKWYNNGDRTTLVYIRNLGFSLVGGLVDISHRID